MVISGVMKWLVLRMLNQCYQTASSFAPLTAVVAFLSLMEKWDMHDGYAKPNACLRNLIAILQRALGPLSFLRLE